MIYYLFTLQLNGMQFLAFFLAYAISLLIAFVLHELSHGLVAYWCGDKTAKAMGRLSLNPFKHLDAWGMVSFLFVGFGWAKPVPVNPLNFRNYKKGIRLVSCSGVVTNFVLGLIFSCLLFFFGGRLNLNSTIGLFAYFLLSFSTSLNISLALFNLLPIYPLDGFNFLASFLRTENKFVQFMYRYGGLVLMIFIILPVFDIIYHYAVFGVEELFFKLWRLF